jgi:transposase
MEGIDMAGRFEGLSDAEWKLMEDIFTEKEKRGRGRPAVSSRITLNSLLYVLIIGSRWCVFRAGRMGIEEFRSPAAQIMA